MRQSMKSNSLSRCFRAAIPVACLLLLTLPSVVRAQDHPDFDQYKLRVDGLWFYSSPSGTLTGQGEEAPIDFQKDLGFNSYSTFGTSLDWKFTRKNHLIFEASRFNSSNEKVLERTIVFQGTTFDVGLQTQGSLNAVLYSPGYRYDIIRRKRGHLALGVQFNIFDTTAKLSAQAQVINNGEQQEAARSASASLLAPIPVAGPQYRLYLTNSPRVFIEGDVYGMYFFGYGNYVSTTDSLGVTLTKHIALKAGYQLASRLIVNAQTDRIGLHMTQQGATTGLEFSF
jgi:hypothetical protein